jgi:hypothetical protein
MTFRVERVEESCENQFCLLLLVSGGADNELGDRLLCGVQRRASRRNPFNEILDLGIILPI